MAGFTQQNDDDVVASINVAPLVDIMLVLLIIFMMTASFMKDPVIPVKLPRAATAQEAKVDSMAVTLNEEGQLFINGQPSSPSTVSRELKRALLRDRNLQVIVAADGRIDYDRVVDVINLVKETGVQEFALNVRKPTAAGD